MNLYDIPKKRPEQELLQVLAQSEHIRIERIVSMGHTTSWYDQEENEWICLLEGEADIQWEDGSITTLKKGSTLFLPRRRMHRVARTTQCIWLCVFWRD